MSSCQVLIRGRNSTTNHRLPRSSVSSPAEAAHGKVLDESGVREALYVRARAVIT
jgi:hypothetical protein